MAQKTQRNHDHFFKVLLVGDSGVGKTTIMSRFDSIRTVPEITLAGPSYTTGIDFVVKTVNIDGERVKLQVWDTAGQEKFRTITTAYYRGACGVVLVYNVGCRDSFLHLEGWTKNVKDNCDSQDVVTMMVGNYNELPEKKEVPTEEADAFAKEHSMDLLEISSEDSDQIEQMFLTLARKMLIIKKKKPRAAGAVGSTATPDQNAGTEKKCYVM